MRCLVGGADWGGARAKASELAKGKGTPRLMTAVYNALGDCERNAGKTREAMLCYLRGVAQFQAAAPSPEHEYAMAYSAIAEAEFAKAAQDKEQKQKYLARAQALLGNLIGQYGASDLSKKVEEALR